jgi:hypothetical protein
LFFGKKYKAGVSFTADHAQIAVLEFRKENISLVHLQEIENDRLGEHWYLQPLITKSVRAYKKVSGVSLAFDNSTVDLHMFPMDTSLSREEQQEHTQWEMTKFNPAFTPKDYLLDVHTMKIRAKEHLAELFVVSARRSSLQNVQSMLGDHRIGFDVADINFFGGQYALLVNYPEVRAKTIAVVEIGTGRLDMGVLNFGRLAAFRCAQFATPQECTAAIEQFLAASRGGNLSLRRRAFASDAGVGGDIYQNAPRPHQSVPAHFGRQKGIRF